MVTKADFFQAKKTSVSAPVDELRAKLNWIQDNLPKLSQQDGEIVLDIFKRLDTVQANIVHLESETPKPDLAPEKARLETIQRGITSRSNAYLGKFGGTAKLQQLRPPEALPETHPWWYVDLAVAEKRAAILKRVRWTAGIGGTILIVLVILFNTIWKPDPILIQRIQHVDTAIEAIETNQDYEVALQEVDQALIISPEDMELLLLKIVILENLDRADETDLLLKEAQDLAQSPEQVPFFLGRTYFRVGQLEQALIQAEAAIEINDEYAEAWLLAGQVFNTLGQVGEAYDALQKAADLAFEQGKDTIYTTAKINMAYLSPSIQ